MIQIISYIAMTLSISGNYFVNRKNVLGLWIWLVGSILWVSVAIFKNDYPQLIMFLIYIGFSIEGIIKWSKK